MNQAKKGLGRGLSALFGDIENKSNSKELSSNKISIADIERNKYQPRTIFNDEKLNELSESIRINGIIQPIAVRVNKYEKGKYEIVAGERRWLAAQRAGLNEVPVFILDIDDQKSLEIAIVENVQRQDLNIIEEAKGYQRLVKEFGYDHEKISKFMSKSRSHVSNTLRLLTLPEDIIGLLEEEKLTAGQARPLIGMPNASEIAENDKDGNIGLSIGKKSFSDDKLIKNFNAVITSLEKEKTNFTIKGDLIKSTYITSTMGVSYKIKLEKSF